MPLKLPRLVWLCVPLAYFLYFFRLGGAGLIGPDEPRYAAIGRAMARTGDWVTPRLWGHAWFEKPALLYWMTGAGFRLGLGPDLAPRLPVAILSVAFLVLFYWMVRREFGCLTARLATLILGTSAAWIGFSQVGVTDLPLTATFSAAMLLALPWIAKRDTTLLPWAGAALGLAVLAKGLLPLVLVVPLVIRVRWVRDLLRPRVWVPFAAVAVPWYVLCYLRNGPVFPHEFFVVHHFQRFTSPGLQHVQPWWFYIPRLPLLLLPWAPLLVATTPREDWQDPRRRFLLVWAGFGLLFFSASTNKLVSYLLPLLPPLAILMAIGVSAATMRRERMLRSALVCCGLLLVVFPVAAPMLPAAAANMWSAAPHPAFHWTWLLPLIPAAAAWLLVSRGRVLAAAAVIAAATGAAVAGIKVSAEPEMERLATARALSREVARHPGATCLDGVRRDWEYGLDYYLEIALPSCSAQAKPFRVVQRQGFPPELAGAAPLDGTNTAPPAVDPR